MQNSRLGKFEMLLQISQVIIMGDGYFAGIRGFLALNHFKKRGFTVSVSSHKPYFFPGVDVKSDVRKKNLFAESFGQIIHTNHRLPSNTRDYSTEIQVRLIFYYCFSYVL